MNIPYRRAAIASVLALLGVAVIWDVSAQDAISGSRRTALVTAIERVSPAVVTINVLEYERQMFSPFMDDFWQFFHGPGAGPRDRVIQGIGTGFIFDQQGHILTNFHVLQDADEVSSVTLPDGRKLNVELVGFDERTDLAVLRAQGADLPYVPLGSSDDLMVGEWVIAIGNPFGNIMRDSQPSVSAGIVSANHRRVSREVGGGERLYQNLIQTDAAINPGNSGGPLVNALGDVVGVNTMILSNTGGSQGLGFAIPISRAKRVADEIIQYGRRLNPWMGFRGAAVAELTPYARQQLNVGAAAGVLVTEIVSGSPAFEAGLRAGDVVTGVNGEAVEFPVDVDFVNWGLFVGDTAILDIDRGGRQRRVEFRIEELTGSVR